MDGRGDCRRGGGRLGDGGKRADDVGGEVDRGREGRKAGHLGDVQQAVAQAVLRPSLVTVHQGDQGGQRLLSADSV
jgi:hypothetical protein